MNLNNVNRKNTREWALFNGNARGDQNRKKLIEKHGGEFKWTGTQWLWESRVKKTIQFSHTKKSEQFIFLQIKMGLNTLLIILLDFAENEKLMNLLCMM